MVLTSALVFFYFRDLMNFFLDWGEYHYKKAMEKSDVQKCLDWLFQQKAELETASFGRGRVNVLEALAIQHSKVKDIASFNGEIERLSKSEKNDDKSIDELSGIYQSVKALSDKRSSCLEVISQIASLEDHIQTLSTEFDARSVFLVTTSDVTKNKEGFTQPNESLARTSQACILSVRQNWKWIFQLLQCSEVHLRNAAAYQEFFQEVEEAEHWLNVTLSRIHLSFDRSKLLGNKLEADSILQEINEVLAAYLLWQTKVDYLFNKAKEVVPVPLRLNPLTGPRPVIALTDFKSSEIEIIEGEALTLLDNSDRKKWKVRTEAGQIGFVPAVIILITPPASEAVDTAIRLRLQLLALWTSSVKRLGCQLIAYMLLVIRDWNEEEVKQLQSMPASDKRELLRILCYLELTLVKNWNNYGDFQELQSRITRLKMILEENIDQNPEGTKNSLSDSLVAQLQALENLLNKYKEFWSSWEAFKCGIEMLKQPRFLLVCDKWDQLKFVTSADFVKFWNTQLDLTEEDANKLQAVCEAPLEESVNSEVTIEEKREQTSTDTVTSTLEEEQHTFIIKSVLDPRDDQTLLSLEDAVAQGIVDESQKHYTNPKTKQTKSMTDAMNEGRIIIEFVSRRKIREENKSYGVITITIIKETKPYTITAVLDPVTDEKLTVSKAKAKNILDTSSSTYRTENGELIPIVDAIHSGLVIVEYHEGESESTPEIVTKTYAVHGIVDQQKKEKVSFSDALNDGLLDRETGEYVNNVTQERVGVHDAILKGFIKARVVSDPSKLDVNPENTIIVEKLSTAKTKLLKSVKAVKAFKAGDV